MWDLCNVIICWDGAGKKKSLLFAMLKYSVWHFWDVQPWKDFTNRMGVTCHCSNAVRFHAIPFLSGNSSHHTWTVLILTCCPCDFSWTQHLFHYLMLVAAGCVQLFIYFQNLHSRVIPMVVKRKHQPTLCLFPGVNSSLCFFFLLFFLCLWWAK